MQSPLSTPQGMLRNLLKVQDHELVFQLLLEAGEKYAESLMRSD